MSFITIQCRLVANEEIRRQIWHLMADKNTPLVNELLKQVSLHDDFDTWLRWGVMPEEPVVRLRKSLQTQPQFAEQPGRFYSSASSMVTQVYESWLRLHHGLRQCLNGKQHWLNVVKSDAELVEMSGYSISRIKERAQEILIQLEAKRSNEQEQPKQKNTNKTNLQEAKADVSVMDLLFDAYKETSDILSRCAIAHLLKNNCQVCKEEEDPAAFEQRILRKQQEIEQLKARLESRLPKGRDLTGEKFLETLSTVTNKIPGNDVEQMLWQARLLAKPATLPYPIIFGSPGDLRWSTNQKGRICVALNGLNKFIHGLKQNPLQIYCDQRQLPLFQRFLEEWKACGSQKSNYPTELLIFRTARLVWREGKGKGEPWQRNYLTLHCSINIHYLAAEETEHSRQVEISRFTKKLAQAQAPIELTKMQQKEVKKLEEILALLQNRPQFHSRPSYQGQPDILVGVSIGRIHPVTAAVINVRTNQVLAYRSTRQLLGDNYRLLNRKRRQQQQNALKRHRNQTKGYTQQPSESELGQYVDRLLAKSVIELAKQFHASSIVLPETKGLRAHLAGEITAKAKQKSDSKEVQDKYAKQVRISIHNWSYDRLLTTLGSYAGKAGMTVETSSQPREGTAQEKARDVALTAYHFRQVSSN